MLTSENSLIEIEAADAKVADIHHHHVARTTSAEKKHPKTKLTAGDGLALNRLALARNGCGLQV